MAVRCRYESSSDIGVFATLTNAYCLASLSSGSTNFFSTFEAELGDVVPVVHTTIGGTRIIGRLTAGALGYHAARERQHEAEMSDFYRQPTWTARARVHD